MNSRNILALLLAITVLLPLASKNVFGQSRSTVTPQSLKAEGLENSETLLRLYVGDFSGIEFRGDDLRESALFMLYVRSYSRKCEIYLPENKIQLTKQVCVREIVTTNMYGVVTNRQCTEYETRPIDTYMHPRLQEAKAHLEVEAVVDLLEKSVEAMQDIQKSMERMVDGFDLIEFVNSLRRDMAVLVSQHSCMSAEMKHFEENLRLYVLGQRPIVLEYDESLFAGPAPPPNPKSLDYERLTEDLIREESRTWRVNQYVRGSISNLSVGPRDQHGYPRVIEANYLFKSFGGREQRGFVTISFESGVPECIYFFDFPERCRKPQERIIESYSSGRYSSESSGASTQGNGARSDQIYVFAEEQPDCGGVAALQESVEYPQAARSQGIEGRVFVQFVVDETGAIGATKVTRRADPMLDLAALEAVRKLSCTPGRRDGRPVKVQLSLPVTFRL
jgi:TonB family protein